MSARNVIATTKRLLLTSAVLGVVGAIGPANAATLNWTSVNAWQGATPGQNASSGNQQALPSATGGLTLTLTSFAGGPINFNLPAGGTNNIPGFFATAGTTLSATDCPSACQTNVLSTGGFANVTIMEFTFTDTSTEIFSVNHDDGVSLFDITTSSGNLLPLSASAPTTLRTDSVLIQPGTYELWFAEANGLPATLQATSTVVPLPGALPLFASGLLGLGLLGRRKRKALSA
jgi:hypothetical protein